MRSAWGMAPPLPASADAHLTATAVEEDDVRQALTALDDSDLVDVLSPLQLEELLLMGAASGGPSVGGFAEAARQLSTEELYHLISPLQRGLLAQRHGRHRRSTMLCDSFFKASGEGSLAASARGQPLLPSRLRLISRHREAARPRRLGGVIGIADGAEGAGSDGARSESPESLSTDDTVTGGSRASSLSWISDDGGERGMRQLAPDHSRRASEASRATTAGGYPAGGDRVSRQQATEHSSWRPSEASKATTAAGCPAGPPAPAAARYPSYREMPSWQQMAERAAGRMDTWTGPNAKPPWESTAGGHSGNAAAMFPAVAAAGASRGGNGGSSWDHGAEPVSLFEKVKAVQQRRRQQQQGDTVPAGPQGSPAAIAAAAFAARQARAAAANAPSQTAQLYASFAAPDAAAGDKASSRLPTGAVSGSGCGRGARRSPKGGRSTEQRHVAPSKVDWAARAASPSSGPKFVPATSTRWGITDSVIY